MWAAGVAPSLATCTRRLPRAVAVAAVSGPLQGCAVDTPGTLVSRATRADSAVVVDLYTLGVHLRTRSEDRGLTNGLGRRSYVVAVEDAGNVFAG